MEDISPSKNSKLFKLKAEGKRYLYIIYYCIYYKGLLMSRDTECIQHFNIEDIENGICAACNANYMFKEPKEKTIEVVIIFTK